MHKFTAAQREQPRTTSSSQPYSTHAPPLSERAFSAPAGGVSCPERSAARFSLADIPIDHPRAKRTGLPPSLKTGVERLSGYSLDDVRVHYRSPKPAQINALAYTQGTHIYVGPHQEQHLAHEAWHVVQQKQRRVKPTLQAKLPMNVERGLEREADIMGERARAIIGTHQPHHAEQVWSQAIGNENAIEHVSHPQDSASNAVVQPRLGFELEMHVLVDISGRPVPEKVVLGTFGVHNLELVADHGAAVEAPTPRPGHAANMTFTDTTAPAPHPVRNLGRYDLDTAVGLAAAHPPHEASMEFHNPTGLPLPADPRATMPARNDLDLVTWNAHTAGNRYIRPGGLPVPPFNNAALATIDGLIGEYDFEVKNWEAFRAVQLLLAIRAQIGAWQAANPRPSLAHPYNRNLWTGIHNRLNFLRLDTVAHQAWWVGHPNPPQAVAAGPGIAAVPGMRRQYRPAGGVAPWTTNHPLAAGMGADTYASILEIVTPAYEPETVAGRANIIAAMQEAHNLAQAIEVATGNLAHRVPLNSIVGTAGIQAGTHIGNEHQPAQTTSASIQTTLGVDLHQIPSLFKSIMGMNIAGTLQTEFQLKHHSDTYVIHRVDTVAARAARIAQQIIRDPIHGMNIAAGGIDLNNLRGLLTIMCQYLLMGMHFYGHGTPLDKNVVPLLSRNDLGSVIFAELVPPAERLWAQGNLVPLRAAILHFTGRAGASDVFNDAAETQVGVAGLTCTQFINNVFAGIPDGITAQLGGFRSFPHGEDIDPAGVRGGEHRRGGVPHREGAIFELRNMVPHAALGLVGTDRFPRNRWVPLATYMADMLTALNARTMVQSRTDTRYRQAGVGPMGPYAAGVQNEALPW